MSFLRHRIKKRIAAGARFVRDWALFISIVIAGGVGSSWYMVEAGNRFTTTTVGPWVTWNAVARTDADPYTRAHFAKLGALALSSDMAETYLARTDDDGRYLHSSCDYLVKTTPAPNSWWSLTVYDKDGALIDNTAGRHAYTSETAAVNADGSVSATLARAASPGNWLPTSGAGRLAAVFIKMDYGTATGTGDSGAKNLPVITRGDCR